MQKQGTIVRWDAARAFGFIRSPQTSADVFFHIRDFRGAAPPKEGLAVTYEEIHVGGKGPRAMAVQPASAPGASGAARGDARSRPARRSQARREPAASPASASLFLLLAAGWFVLLGWGLWTRQLPPWWWTLGAVLAVNLLTFWAYAADKNAARHGRWRIPENNLHLLSLLGGWPGAWLAQQAMRHKASKREFRAVYWLTVAAHCAGLAAWVTGWLRGLSLPF